MSGKLDAIYVAADDVDVYAVGDEGWYVMDDDLLVIDGPFETRKECIKAMEDAAKPQAA